MTYFLLTYDRTAAEVDVAQFSDGDEAMDSYYALELTHLASKSIEVVLLTADKMSDLHRTHGRYFRPAELIPA